MCFVVLAFGGTALFQWLNVPTVQHRIAAWISRHTSWEVSVDSWQWRLLANTLVVENLTLHHRTTGHRLHADHLTILYSPWGLPVGRFKVRNLLLDGVACDFSHMQPPTHARKRINLRKLLVLKRLTVQTATVNEIRIAFPREVQLATAVLRLQLLPALLTDVRLNVHTEGNTLTRGTQSLADLSQLTFAGTTDLNRWVNTPPFVNAVKGALTVAGGTWRNVTVNEMQSVLSFNHGRFGLDNLHAQINGEPLEGSSHIDLEETTYALQLRWPKPMPVPELFGSNRLFNTAGTLEGHITLKGRGFDPYDSEGEGAFDLTHVPTAPIVVPAHFVGKAAWKAGLLTLGKTELLMDSHGQTRGNPPSEHREREGGTQQALPASSEKGNRERDVFAGVHGIPFATSRGGASSGFAATRSKTEGFAESMTRAPVIETGRTQVTGTVQLREQKIALAFQGERVPMAGVFSRFQDHHFHPIRGVASVDGRFTGWARNYVLDLTAEATDARYYDIALERVRLKLHLTYPRLEFSGQILQGGRTTGQTDLTITYGPKIGNQPRGKQLHLTARLEDHNLAPSFAAYHLTGTGSGTLTIDGPTQNYRGTGQAMITNGALYALPLTRVQTKIALAPLLLTYTDAVVALADLPAIDLPQPLKMPITPEGFRLIGTPRAGLSLDMSYRIANYRWTVHSIQYTDPDAPDRRLTITGDGATGHWNLGIRGTASLSLLESLRASVREATGPVAVDLRLTGALDNPQLQGTASLRNATLLLRALPYHLEELTGLLRFQGETIRFDPLTGRIGDGTFGLTGSVRQAGLALTGYDVGLRGQRLHYASADRHFRAEVDTDVQWRGGPDRSTVTGGVTILDAKYDRDFRVLEQMGRGGAAETHAALRAIQEGWERIGLDLRVRSTGDIWIRNNAADVALRADTTVMGSLAHPQFRGAIEATEGKLHYLGLNFDIAHGLVEFHAPFAHPYIEMTGEKEVREYLVQITLRGPADNLALHLTSTPSLEPKDVLALVAFGATQDELRSAQFGAQIGPSVFLEQVGKIVERPISRLTGLDVVRVETQTGRGGGTEGSRLYLGKRLSDRLAIEFVTGISEQKAEQGYQIEYNLTDSLLLKAGQPAGEKTKVNMSLRFRER